PLLETTSGEVVRAERQCTRPIERSTQAMSCCSSLTRAVHATSSATLPLRTPNDVERDAARQRDGREAATVHGFSRAERARASRSALAFIAPGCESCWELFQSSLRSAKLPGTFQSSFRSAKLPGTFSVVFSVCKVAGSFFSRLFGLQS